jgi:hypothetical protein
MISIVDTVPYSRALSNCCNCDVIEWTLFSFQVSWSRIFIVYKLLLFITGKRYQQQEQSENVPE